jgi:hypothetical protein
MLCKNCPNEAGPERWRTLCRRCFAKQKEAEEHSRDEALARANEEIAALNAAVRQLLRERTAPGKIPPARLRQLIQLCHPDRHGGSKVSTEVTQWLLSMKG